METLDAAALESMMRTVVFGGLLFVRVLAVLVVAPLFSHWGIPLLLRSSLALMVVVALLPGLPPQPTLDLHPFVLAALVMKEALVGLFIGFVSSSVLYAARFAGGMIDMNTGFQTALLFDPSLGGFPTLIGELLGLATLMLFFWIDGPHLLLLALGESVRLIPLSSTAVAVGAGAGLVQWMGSITALALSIAAPVLAAQFLSLWALALLARVAPQINIFMLSFSVKVIVGLGMLVVSTPLMAMLLRTALRGLATEVLLLVRSLSP